MSFQGVTFDGQNVSPKDDGALYAAHNGDGIIDGCDMTIGGNNDTLVIQSGHIIACGRVCQVNGATELQMPDIASNMNYVQVYLQYDVSQAEGNQWDWGYNQQAALPFGALTQEDINGTGNIYQIELAILEASNSSLTDFNSQMGVSAVTVYHPTEGKAYIFESDGGAGFSARNGNNDSIGGMSAFWTGNGGTAVTIYGDSRAIRIRPNGVAVPDGQFTVGQGTASLTGESDNSENIYLNAGTTGTSIYRYNGGRKGGMSMFTVGGVEIYDDTATGISFAPDGLGQTSHRAYLFPNGDFQIQGQKIGGVTKYSSSGTVTAQASVRTVVCSVSNLPAGKYLVCVYGRNTPSTNTAHYPIFGIALNNSDQRYFSSYSASTGQKYYTFSDVLEGSGTISIIYNGGIQATAYGLLNIFRIA